MIVVVGGAGFIGSNILAGLQVQGYRDLVAVDWLGKANKWNNIAKRELAAVVAPENMWQYLVQWRDSIDTIVHMGAISSTTEMDVDLIINTNFVLSWRLWEFCRDYDKRFIYASSAATYGDGSLGFCDDNSVEFLNSLRPLNPYGWSKALFDRKVAREVREGRGTPTQYVGLKFFNVYGPNEYHKGNQMSVVAHIFPDAKAHREVKLFRSYDVRYRDGEQLRDFVWVGDVVSVVLWMMRNPQVNGIFNVGTGAARSFHELAEAVYRSMDVVPIIGYRDMPAELRDKYQYYTQADLTRLRAVGYSDAMTSLEDGVCKYVQEYLNGDDMYV